MDGWVDVADWFTTGSGSTEPVSLDAADDASASSSLPLKSRRIEALVDADLGVCATTETLKYVCSKECSATFKFPLPPKVAIHRFEAKIGGRVIRTATKKVEAARTEFQEATDQGHSAVLLEQKSSDIFSVKLGNLPAGQACEITVGYLALVDVVDGCLEYLHTATWVPPYQGPRDTDEQMADTTPAFAQKLEYEVSYRLEVRCQAGVHAVDTRDAVTTSYTPSGCVVEQAATVSDPSRDFQVMVEVKLPSKGAASPAASLLKQEVQRGAKATDTKTVIKAVFAPEEPAEAAGAKEGGSAAAGPGKEMWLVVDCSGSMGGSAMEQAREAALFFVKDLPVSVGVKFNIVAFGSDHRFLYDDGCHPYDSTTQAQAVEWIQTGLWADMGGTEILGAMRAIYAVPITPGYDREIIFLTDGGISGSQEGALWRLVSTGAVPTPPSQGRPAASVGPVRSHGVVSKLAGRLKSAGKPSGQEGADGKERDSGGLGGPCRVFCLGIGCGVHRGLLDGMAERSQAIAAYVSHDENIAVKAGMLKRCAMGQGMLKQPKLAGRACMVKTVPAVLPPALFPGQPITILAEVCKAEPEAALRLSASRADGSTWSQEVKLEEAVRVEGDVLAVLHAMGYISELLKGTSHLHMGQDGKPRDQSASEQQVVEEVVRVATAENLVTPHTATVGVLCQLDPLDPAKVQHVDIPIQLPAGRTLWGTAAAHNRQPAWPYGQVSQMMYMPQHLASGPPLPTHLGPVTYMSPQLITSHSSCASVTHLSKGVPRGAQQAQQAQQGMVASVMAALGPRKGFRAKACERSAGTAKQARAAPGAPPSPTLCYMSPQLITGAAAGRGVSDVPFGGAPAAPFEASEVEKCARPAAALSYSGLGHGGRAAGRAVPGSGWDDGSSDDALDADLFKVLNGDTPMDEAQPPLSPKEALHELNLQRTVEGYWKGESSLLQLLARAVRGTGGGGGVSAEQLKALKPGALGEDAWATVLVLAFLRKHLSSERRLWEDMASKAQGWLQANWPADAPSSVGAATLSAMKQL